MDNEALKQVIATEVANQLKGQLFTARKLTDNPTDGLQVVPRQYVTRSFTTTRRPTTSIIGESYFDTSAGKPAWWNGTNYQDAAGNVI